MFVATNQATDPPTRATPPTSPRTAPSPPPRTRAPHRKRRGGARERDGLVDDGAGGNGSRLRLDGPHKAPGGPIRGPAPGGPPQQRSGEKATRKRRKGSKDGRASAERGPGRSARLVKKRVALPPLSRALLPSYRAWRSLHTVGPLPGLHRGQACGARGGARNGSGILGNPTTQGANVSISTYPPFPPPPPIFSEKKRGLGS